MGASTTSIGTLVVHLTAQTLQYTSAMRMAERTTTVRMASMMKTVKLGTAAMAASFAVLGIASVRAFSQFESSFAGVEKTVDASRKELDALAMSFRRMSKEIPVNVNEINRVGEAAGQLGIEVKNIEAFTKTMLELGVATNLSATDAATALARLANITQLPQTEFDRLGSAIVALGNNLATTEAEIVSMSLRLAGAASTIGLTEAQILGLAGALSSVGIRAELGGTAFARVMIEMNNAVGDAGLELQIFADVAGKTVEEFAALFEQDASEAIITFVEGLKRLDDTGQNVNQTLDALGLEGIRVQDTLLRASGAGDLLRRSIELSTKAWSENSALTEEVQKRYKTFASQVTVLVNRFNDFLITIGSHLVPVLKVLIDMTSQTEGEMDAMADTAKFLANVLKVGLLGAVIIIGDVIFGWMLIFKGVKIVVLALGRQLELFGKKSALVFANVNLGVEQLVAGFKIFAGVNKVFLLTVLQDIINFTAKAVDPIINIVNTLIEKLNDLTGTQFKTINLKLSDVSFDEEIKESLRNISQVELGFKEARAEIKKAEDDLNSFTKVFDAGTDEMNQSIKQTQKELEEMIRKGSPSTRFLKGIEKAQKDAAREALKNAEAQDIMGDAIQEAGDKAKEQAEKMQKTITATAQMRKEVEALRESLKTPFEKGLDDLAKYQTFLDAGLISQNEFNLATAKAFPERKLGIGGPGGLEPPGGFAPGGAPGFGGGSFGGAGQGVVGGFGGGATGPGSEQANKQLQLQNEQAQLEAHFRKLEEITRQGEETVGAARFEVVQRLQEQTLERLEANQLAQGQLMVQGIGGVATELTGILKQTAGEQSGIFKAMFVVSKAFAIADSIIKIQQGVANALSLPFPLNLGAVAAVIGQASGIISTIQSASFEGGGRTPSGPRSGGVDGRGGFMAVLHPDEKITDLKKDGEPGGGVVVNWEINIMNQVGGEATAKVDEDSKRIDILIKRVDSEMAGNIRAGRGETGKAIGETFNIARGRQ